MRRNRKNKINIKNKRIHIVLYGIFIIFLLLTIRVSWYSIVKNKKYSKLAYNQRLTKIDIFPSRGNILDRNNQLLTNKITEKKMFIFKYKLEDEYLYNYVLDKTGISKEKLDYLRRRKEDYELLQLPVLIDINEEEIIKEVFVLDITKRYDDSNILSHVIGHMNDNGEGSGIEKSRNDDLINDKVNNSIVLARDGSYRFWPELNYEQVINNEIPYKSYKLTVDYDIQKIVEETIDKYERNGSVIVADVDTGDILAMASRPNFELNNMAKYLESTEENFINKAIAKTYPPASLFKIVVMVAALKENLVDLEEKFTCTGVEVLADVETKCKAHEDGERGELDIYEAFEESCNSTFIQLGKRIGKQKIIEVAKEFGFGEKISIGLGEEIDGNLPANEKIDGPSLAKISIGQNDIEVTPLQITNMMMIIANNGIEKDLDIRKGYVTSKGIMLTPQSRYGDIRIINNKYTDVIKKMMERVVSNGTASKYVLLEDIGGAAGKTGTAEIGSKKNTSWFSGYFPKDNPKYVITVLVEDVKYGGKNCGTIFKDIAKEINKIYKN